MPALRLPSHKRSYSTSRYLRVVGSVLAWKTRAAEFSVLPIETTHANRYHGDEF